MLVLGRDVGQRIIIQAGSELIKIELIEVRQRRKHVRLGISAPQHIQVWREEIHEGQPGAQAVTPPPCA